MDLKEHLYALIDPALRAKSEDLTEHYDVIAEEMDAAIAEAKEDDDYIEVSNMLYDTVCQISDDFGRRADFMEKFIPPLKAFVEHVLAECPDAREGFEEGLVDMPEMKAALL